MTSDRDKTLLDLAADVFVFAPLGAALTAREVVPDLAERGRRTFESQVTMARMIGEFAVRQGRSEIEKAYDRAREQATTTLQTLGVVPPPAGNGRTPTPAPPPRPPRARPEPAAPAAPAGPPVETLAIPDYDSLSASQVVPRLAGLSDDELEAVRAYEAAHRSRKTILNRIGQLTS